MSRKATKNWRWTRNDIIRELGKDGRTVGKMLAAAEIDSLSEFSSRQVFTAMVGDLTAERTREARERADKLALENAASRRELVPAKEFAEIMARGLESVRATILSAANLENEDKDKIIAQCRDTLARILGVSGRVPTTGAEPTASDDGEPVG